MKTVRVVKRSRQQGQAIVLIAFGMIGFLAFAVLAIDGGKYYDQRRTAQNAADAGSLAGLYQHEHGGVGATNDQAVLTAINTAVEKNGIPDSDAGESAADADNVNVEAYWINNNGDYVNADNTTTPKTTEPPPTTAQIVNDATKSMPAGATGIKVRTFIPYTTFIGQIIGQKNLRAQADGVALVFPGTTNPPNPNGTYAIWTGGGNCNTATHPALYWGGASANNTDWGNGVTVNGWLRIDNQPNDYSKHGGSGPVVVVAGPNTAVDSGGHALNGSFTSNYTYAGPGSTQVQALTNSFPDWAYLKPGQLTAAIPPNLPKSQLQIQASFYKPDEAVAIANNDLVDTPANAPVGYTGDPYRYKGISSTAADVPSGILKNWIFQGHEANLRTGRPPFHFFHYINEPGDTAGTRNGDDFAAMVAAGDTGVFFIDGNLDTDLLWPDGVTVVATGTVHVNVNGNNKVGNAGIYAFGMSVLAGGSMSGMPPGNPDTACATPDLNGSNWILHFEGQQNGWDGVVYVPNGLFWIDTNYHASIDPVGPIVAWSQATALSGGHPGNNFQFSTCNASCLPQPTYQMGLQQ